MSSYGIIKVTIPPPLALLPRLSKTVIKAPKNEVWSRTQDSGAGKIRGVGNKEEEEMG